MQFSISPAPFARQLRVCCRPTRLEAAQCCHRVTAPAPALLPVELRRAESSVLPAGLRAESMPRHVAVVMDGNSRWARARGLPTQAGHEAMKRAFEELVWRSRAWGIRVLTVYIFSHENWGRPKAEVDFMMGVFERCIHENVARFVREGMRVRVIGDCSRLPVSLQNTIKEAEERTSNNSQFDLILAISYSGRWDIVRACANLAQKVHDKLLSPDDIDELLFAMELQGSCATEFPYPDLLIRTSGELRLSNFLLWESAYTEFFFTQTLWPDFGEAGYLEALISFQGRNRRFGRRP